MNVLLAFLHVAAAIFTRSLDKSANMNIFQYGLSDFFVVSVSQVLKGGRDMFPQSPWLRRP